MTRTTTMAFVLAMLSGPALAVTVQAGSGLENGGRCDPACPGSLFAAQGARPASAPNGLPLHTTPLPPMWFDPDRWSEPTTRRADDGAFGLDPRSGGISGAVRPTTAPEPMPVVAKVPVPAGLPLMMSALAAIGLASRPAGKKRATFSHTRRVDG